MGNGKSKQQPDAKLNKDHKRDKTFRVGLSFGKGDLSAEGHFQMGYVSKTKKTYTKPVGMVELSQNGEEATVPPTEGDGSHQPEDDVENS